MADNYLENHALDYERLKAMRQKKLQARRNLYLAAYKRKLQQNIEKDDFKEQ